ncbi:MAG: tRNA (adenosine(37)-N6)-threonylcarbamoyltransferase complex dimerization subunit type 1 TsaB [Bacteroidetes bacterium]|nr:tRNA (adenosine(37)-N6)-threonylcarbamoyltransferase complex dimerization subunit type 1 TsaB [Bacteroidota bacterium]
MPLILNIETAAESCSVALSKEGVVIGSVEGEELRSHASALTVLIDYLLKSKSISLHDLDAIAVSKGPGSYTGLRIGVSVAKGLCYGAQKPLIAVNTLQSMMQGLREQHPDFGSQFQDHTIFCPMLDARRLEVYLALFGKDGKMIAETEARIIDENSFDALLPNHPMVFFGSGAEKCKTIIKNSHAHFIDHFGLEARFMAPLSYEYFQHNQFENVAYFEPFYLKDFVATMPKRKVI